MQITFLTSSDNVQLVRQKVDCVMLDHKKLISNDSFSVLDKNFDIKLQPLRIVVIRLRDLSRDWIVLNDCYRHNTMIVAGDDDIRANPEICRYLELQGVALLMTKRSEDGFLSLESIMKSLISLKFKSILVEDKIDLIKEF